MLINRFQHRLTAFFSSAVSGFVVDADVTDPVFAFVFFAKTTVFANLAASGLATGRDSSASFGPSVCAFCPGWAASADSQHMTQAPASNHPDARFLISILIG